VDFELGRHAARIFAQAELQIEWKEYTGAEKEHWFKIPDDMDDTRSFLARIE
jgi:hypothetical protein